MSSGVWREEMGAELFLCLPHGPALWRPRLAGAGSVHSLGPLPTTRNHEVKCLAGERGPILAGHPECPGRNTLNVHDLGRTLYSYAVAELVQGRLLHSACARPFSQAHLSSPLSICRHLPVIFTPLNIFSRSNCPSLYN